MTVPQPGQLQKYDTGVTLSSENDVEFSTTISGYRFFYTGTQFGLSEYDTDTNLTEINLWNNDGTRAANFIMEKKYILDVAYDASDEVYYGIRWNFDSGDNAGDRFTGVYETESGTESAPVLLSTAFGSQLAWEHESVDSLEVETTILYTPPTYQVNTELRKWTNFSHSFYIGRDASPSGWETSSWGNNPNFQITTETKGLDLFQISDGSLGYYSTAGLGYYTFDVEVSGNFVAFVDIDAQSFNGNDSVLCLRALRKSDRSADPYNVLASACFRGPTGGSENVQAWFVKYEADSSGNSWSVSNLRINEMFLDADNSSSVVGVTSGGSESVSIAVDDYYTDPTAGVKEKAYLFSVKHGSTNIGDGVFASHEDITARDWPHNGETYRSFSWTGGTELNPEWSQKALSFDVRAGYGWDGDSGVFTSYTTPATEGTSKDINISMTKEATAISADSVRLAIKRVGSTMYVMKRDNSLDIDALGGEYSIVSSLDCEYSDSVKFELFVDGTDGSSNDISVSSFVVRDLFTSEKTGVGEDGSADWTFPVLTVEAYDSGGNVTTVDGITDGGGRVIHSLDVIGQNVLHGGSFSEYYGNVQLATDSSQYAGELYLDVKGDMYKYLKSSLPITATDSGTLASISTTDAAFGTPIRNTLNYNGYTDAGLIYLAENDADPGDGLYVNCIRNETMTANAPRKFAWIDEVDEDIRLYATDVYQPHVLYGLSTSDLKVYLFNMEEDTASFCNVVSSKQIVGANTGEISTATAQVLNAYGDPLESKTVAFSVSSGDGSVSPSSDTTDALGEASTTYTVGSTVGTSSLRAVVTD